MPPLKRQLLSRIHKNGPISFSEFMAACLYDPLHGYYASAKARIGKAGDFVTAVSSGPLFGKLLARQFVQMWELLERPAAWTLVEQGAFDGRLALDILGALAEFAPECLSATTLRIVEPFSRLQTNQAATLRAYRNQVSWHRSIESLPAFCGVHYSNELLDAFPVHRIRSTGTGWEEMKVSAQNADLCWETSSPSCPELAARTNCLPQREAGFLAEVGLQHRGWLSEIQARMQRGWVLTFDYGFPEALFFVPERREGTIAAYRAHKRLTDPLEDPGNSDLTSHVNFTQIATDAIARGWKVAGYADQHRFFTGLVPLHFEDAKSRLTAAAQRELLSLKTLIHPQLMGFQFKALCLHKDTPQFLHGYEHGRDPEVELGVEGAA